MVPYENELEIGEEIRGVVCPSCGGSVAWRKGRAWCYEDGYVEPEAHKPPEYPELGEDELSWLREHAGELEDEV